jgi:hypothetical protein
VAVGAAVATRALAPVEAAPEGSTLLS